MLVTNGPPPALNLSGSDSAGLTGQLTGNAAAEGVEPWPSLQPRVDSSTHAVQPAETAPQPHSELRLATPVQQAQPPQPQQRTAEAPRD
ncbi:hypothetical protein QJQ45_003953 [Haematococcus lacustris]|nr:hypothetical protein QJQ45_003953 [Haematococcus lacustris]